MKVLQQNRQVVLITGASTGVGLALGKKLRDDNRYHIILTAREASLSRFESEGIKESQNLWIRPLDILSKKQRDHLITEIEDKLDGVNILVNNAAYMLRAVVEHVGEEERLKQMDTNFRAPLSLIRRVLPKMREKRAGKIINISSVGGMMSMPTMAIYSASKFALEGATEALWYEVKPWNIKVTLVQPGFINSEGFQKVIQTRESIKAMEQPHIDYFYQYTEMGPFIARLMRLTSATSESVANKIFSVIKQKNPPLRVSGTWDALIFGLLRRFLPRSLYHTLFWLMLPRQLRQPAASIPKAKHKINTNESKPNSSFGGI